MDSLRRLVVAMAAAGAALSVTIYVAGGNALPGLTVIVLGLFAVLSIWIPLRIERAEGTQGFTSEEAVFVALLLTVPPSLVPMTMLIAAAVAHTSRRPGLNKVLFNAGQVGLWSASGMLAFVIVGRGATILSARTVVATLVAVLVANVVSLAALSELMSRLGRGDRGRTWADSWKLNAVTSIGNLSFGLLLGVVVQVDLWATLLASTLMIGLYLGYRGYVGQTGERRRAQDLHDFTSSLLEVTTSRQVVEGLLASVRETLGATMVRVALDGYAASSAEPSNFALSSLSEIPRRLREAVAGASGGIRLDAGHRLSRELERLGYRDGLAASIPRRRAEDGVLLALGRRGLEPWTETHATLFATMATELGVALDNAELFEEVERERARLEAESTKLADVLGAASDGIALISGDGTIETWNPGMSKISGVGADQAVGQPWFVVMRLRDESGNEIMPDSGHQVALALRGERLDHPVLMQGMRRDGTWRWLQCTVSPVAAHGETAAGSVLVARDVTAEHEVDELKSDFIATVSHELRTPLTPLKGFLMTLRRTGGDIREHSLERVFEAMSNQVNRLEALISDLLAVAELDSGQFDLHPEFVDLVDQVTAAAEVEVGPETADRLRIDVRQSISAVADPLAVTRIVRALVSNAIKHTEGPVVVEVDAEEDRAAIRVIDSGPGIPPWEQNRIFGRFERLGDHLQRTQGPGLGLTIARALAHRMQGDVTIESDVGTGSTFTLTLPIARRPRLRLAASE